MEIQAQFTISSAAPRVPCPESYMRLAERLGVITPFKDSTGRRLYSETDIEAVRAHRAAKRAGRTAA
jgi:DNA-binding transcriptional MerR regulator